MRPATEVAGLEPILTLHHFTWPPHVERRGGMLIHGAIIAREYGIPMIASVSNATRIIRTGDLIEVDGTAGVVKVLNRETV